MNTPLPLRIAEELERTHPHEAAATLRAQHKLIGEMRKALEECVGILDHAGISTSLGYCCCGDQIDGHPDAMSAGHSPVDAGDYHAMQAVEMANAAIQQAKEQQS